MVVSAGLAKPLVWATFDGSARPAPAHHGLECGAGATLRVQVGDQNILIARASRYLGLGPGNSYAELHACLLVLELLSELASARLEAFFADLV